VGARSKARKRAVDVLYEADLRDLDPAALLSERVGAPEVEPVSDYTITLVEGVAKNRRRIDELLVEHAEGWTLVRMPAVDRAVLRLGLFELLWSDDVPPAVAIDEAVELVKTLSTDDSPRFVNGVLGRIAGIGDRLRSALRAAEHGAE
jgi:transcription antitermination protein NusB